MSQARDKGTKFLEAAIRYARRGFRVHPLKPGSKEPLLKGWPEKATTDEAQIREWWAKWPNANIGIATGAYGDGYFCVLDFDPRNGGEWYADVGEDVLPPTWVVHTARGGRHYYYRTLEPLRGAKLPDGVDLKGEGGYVVAPPSILLDEKGKVIGEYVWQVDCTEKKIEMGDLSGWVFEKLGGAGVGKSGGGLGSGRSLWLMAPPIPKGMRHDYLVSLAGALYSAGLTEKEVEGVLWAALELLATLEDFEPKRDIPNIVKGLQRWEGENYTMGSLLRRLPEKTAGVVRRVVSGGAVSGEPVGAGADSGQVAGEGGGQEADTGQSDGKGKGASEKEGKGEGRLKDRLFLAAELVSKLEVRQKAGGGICLVYRTADGAELEAACTPKGVKELLGQLGVKVTLAETEQVLGVAKGADTGEAKEKKERKSKTAEIADIKAILWRHKWAKWQGELWQVTTPTLYRADLDRLHGILKQNGLDVGKETLKSYMGDIMSGLPKSRLEGMVVTLEPTYGEVGGVRGLWFCHRGDLYVVTPNGRRTFSAGEWPDGVYTLDTGEEGVLPDWDGEVEHLLKYWEGITSRLAEEARVALAMFLPVLFGQGDIGLILKGDARSGKSTLRRAMAYLRFGERPATPSGLNMRDLLAVLQRRQIVFFDEVNTFSPELQETLKRMITHDKTIMRALYTDLETVETELKGSAIFCTTQLERLASDLRTRCFVWNLEEKGGSLLDTQIQKFCRLLWRKALGGAIKLYQQAAKLKPPPNDFMPEVRFRDWLSWAYRYAVVLGVPEKVFVAVVRKSKRAAHRGDKYEFLIDAISHPDFDPRKEYTISDLIALGAPTPDEVKSLRHGINKESVRADLAALALDAGYKLRIEKKKVKEAGDRKERYWFIFTPLQTQPETDRLQKLLQSVGIDARLDDDDGDDDGAPLPPNNPPTPPESPAGSGAAQDETKTLTDMKTEKKTTPTPPEARGSASPDGGPPTLHAPKTDPKKAPPPSEWAYRAGTTHQDGNGGVSDGLFAPPQAAQPDAAPQPPTDVGAQSTAQDDEYLNDDEVIEYIEERLKLHAEHRLPLETSIEWLRGFLLLHEAKMWELGLKRSYYNIVNREIELQNAIKALGYDELTAQNDPRLRPSQNNASCVNTFSCPKN